MWQLKHVWSWHRNNAPPHVPQPSQGLRLCKLCWSHLCFILESLPFYTNQDLYEYFHNSWHFPTYNSWGNLQIISSRRISSDQSNLIVLQILLRNSTLVSASKKIIWECQQFWELMNSWVKFHWNLVTELFFLSSVTKYFIKKHLFPLLTVKVDTNNKQSEYVEIQVWCDIRYSFI